MQSERRPSTIPQVNALLVRAPRFAAAVLLTLGCGTRAVPTTPSDAAQPAPTSTTAPSSGAPSTGGPAVRSLVSIEPADYSTAVAASQFKVVLSAQGPDIDAQLALLAPSVSLLTWPDMEAVPVSVEAQRRTAGSRDFASDAVRLVPVNRLAERWYLLRVAPVPPPLELLPGGLRLSDGSGAVRCEFQKI